MKKTIFSILFFPFVAIAAEGGYPLDPSPHDPRDLVSLQAGARTFVNYCLGCHGAQYVRYQSLTAIGLTETQIRDHLMFTADKIGEPVRNTISAKEGKQWFGVAPPDLSVIARSRGADWLYTYLRTFYRDPKTTTGWNNAVFPQVAMPHALWSMQGERAWDAEKKVWTQLSPGTHGTVQYDAAVRDLVNFLVYMGEPNAINRKIIGIVVLFVLGLLFILAYALKKEYWRDVK